MKNQNLHVNVLYFVGSLQYGGMEKQVVDLVNTLDRDKFSVTLCCMSRHVGPLLAFVNADKTKVVFLGFRLRYWPWSLVKLICILKREQIDILHTHGYDPGFWGRIAALMARVPVIITHEHGKTLWKRKYQIWFERFANRFTDIRIAVSEDIRRLRIENEHTPPQKIVTIPNGVDVRKFEKSFSRKRIRNELKINPKDFVIGTVGRLTSAKAYNVLIDAFEIVHKEIQNSILLFVGDGELKSDLEKYVAKKDIKDHVRFLGTRSDIPELLSVFDIFVLSSDREGLPVALLEAMAAGLPVIATAVGGIPEVINDGWNGYLVPPGNADTLVEKIQWLLRDREERRKISKNARVTIKENYTIEKTTHRIEKTYEQFTSEKITNENK